MKERKQSSYEMDELDRELMNLPDESRQDRSGESRRRPPQNSRPQKAQGGSGRKPQEKKPRPRKEGKKRREVNKEFARVTYLFITLFLVMAGYLIYFNVVESRDVVNSPYNIRQDLMAERVTRGQILDANGEVLAQTVTAEDGTETRDYPYGEVFAHAVGYAEQGKSGLESTQNFNLLSSNAFFLEQIVNEFRGEKNMGDSVVTTLDANLQQAAYNALGDNKGAVVVMEPDTGKILAMVSKPSFNPGTVTADWAALNSDEDSALLNRATLGQYTPGSTFKLITTLEYMRENPDYSSYSYLCEGSISVDGTTIHCYDSEVHGQETLADSVANSCNASFSNIGLSLDRDSWKETAEDLLFNRDLPCDFSFRQSSFNLTDEDTTAETMMTAMGQGTTQVSPYHMALITSAIANGGRLMRPYMVSEITNYTGASVRRYMPEQYAELMTSQEAAQLTEYMTDVVNYGTGAALSGRSYTVAGKTGTAEVSVDKQTVHSWFVGFASVEDPEIVVSVVIEDADTTSITGVSVAGQIFDAFYS